MVTAKKSLKAKVTTKTKLAQDIVILNVDGESTGAQSIAPDHTPRGQVGAAKVTTISRGIELAAAMPATRTTRRASTAASDHEIREQVEQFLFWQSELLDNKQWAQYIELFADDGVYWMPAVPEQTDWQREASIFAEDKLMMQVRMGRVQHPTAWSQAPMWSTNHLVGNVVIESLSKAQVIVRSRFQMMELRRDQVRHFGGTYRHWLRRGKDGLRISLQRVDLFNAQAPYDYVLQVWV